MDRKSRIIRKYQASFGMTRKEATAHYNYMIEKDSQQERAQIPVYYSKTLKQYVTVPQ
jgi:hypothetical protein